MGRGSQVSLILAFAASVCAGVVSAAPGCAQGNEEADQVNVPPIGKKDTGKGGDGISGDGADTGPIFPGDDSGEDKGPPDTGPVCGDIGTTNTCESVTDLGSIALGATKSATGNLPLSGGDAWFKITFESLDDKTAHPHIKITGADAGASFLFEVVKSCARENFNCTDEDALSTKVTDFEEKWGPDPDAADTGDPGEGGVLIPIALGPGGSVYLRVFRGSAAPTTCDGFTLDISN